MCVCVGVSTHLAPLKPQWGSGAVFHVCLSRVSIALKDFSVVSSSFS